MRTALCIALLALWTPLLGCDDGSASAFDRATAPAREGYPVGPYGTTEGAIIADLAFVTADGGATSLGELRADGGNRLVLLTTAAGWCTACIDEQPTLQALHERYYDAGLLVLVTVFEDAEYNPATPTLAGDWRARYALDVPVVADPDFALADYYDPTLTPLTMILDADTMEIVWTTTGFDETSVEAILDARLR